MHVLVTGAGGFVGQALVQRLLHDGAALPFKMTRLTLIDQHISPAAEQAWLADPRVRMQCGDFGAAPVLDAALGTPPDCVFHLASVPGSRAEQEPALGLQVNLLATIALLHRLAALRTPPRVVFASSVAVYGALPLEGAIDETAPVQPALSYGAHKHMAEVLLADLSRRGQLDGVSLRLPGIVARPLSPTGHGSAFMSDLIRQLMAQQAITCPVSAAAQCWWMSLPCCIDNLLHAARLSGARLTSARVVQLPVLTATTGALVSAIEALTGHPARVDWQPDPRTESLFGRLPVLHTPLARALGFKDDADLSTLVRQALAPQE